MSIYFIWMEIWDICLRDPAEGLPPLTESSLSTVTIIDHENRHLDGPSRSLSSAVYTMFNSVFPVISWTLHRGLGWLCRGRHADKRTHMFSEGHTWVCTNRSCLSQSCRPVQNGKCRKPVNRGEMWDRTHPQHHQAPVFVTTTHAAHSRLFSSCSFPL